MNKKGGKIIDFFPKNKRGQYYLIAAIIFIGIIFILISVVNESKKETNTRIYELSKEMKIESSKVMEYYSYTGYNQIEDFTKKYSEYVGERTDIYFILGNLTTQEVYTYTGGESINITELFFDQTENILNATIEEQLYSFNFEKGENFYFVIIQKEGDEEYILRG